jgi:DNA-binding transcriptional regulator of glucitol operon
MVRDKQLRDLYEAKITNSKKAAPILNEEDKAIFERTVHEQFKYIKEESFSGDIARVGDILVPMWRRAFPQIFGKELVGVQPMNGPSGHIYSIRHFYDESDAQSLTKPGVVGGVNGPTGPQGSTATFHLPTSVIVEFTSTANCKAATATGDYIAAGDSAANVTDTNILAALDTGATTPQVIYSEDTKALIKIDNADVSDLLAADTDATGTTIAEVTYNQAGYKTLFKGYSGPFNTFEGEKKGSDMMEVGFNIEKKLIEANTRKMRASYTMEAAQDLQAVHGKDLASELINHLTYEITASINKDLLDAVRAAAAIDSAYDLSSDSDGRWSAEQYKDMFTQLLRMSNKIAETTYRNPGNFLVGSPDVITVLEGLPNYKTNPISSSIDTSTATFNNNGSAYVGNLGGRFQVYRDVNAVNNNTLVGYKGPSQMECGVFWAPYRPIEMYKVTREESGQPRIIFSERSAIDTSPFSSDVYYRQKNFKNLF